MMRYILFIFLLFGAINLSSAQNGWTKAKGEGFFKLGQSFLVAESFFNPEGELTDITTTSVYISSFYGEYGINKRLTGIAYLPFFVRSTINERESTVNQVVEPGDELNGFGDPLIGLKYGLVANGPVVVAAEAYVGIPLGENVGGDTELLQTGDGEFNQLFRLVASSSFSKIKSYANLFVGFNNRTSGDFEFSAGIMEDVEFNDEFHWGGEFGYRPTNSWIFALKWYHIMALDNGAMGMNSNSLFGNNVEYFSITPEINHIFNNNIGVSVAVGTAVSGQNILAAPNFGVGVFYVLEK